MKRATQFLSAIVLSMTVPMLAHAATVTDCGPNVCFQYDDAQAGVALYGLPTLVGDTERFLPPQFRAQSSDGSPANVQTTADFVFDHVYATNAAAEINMVQVLEAGDYLISGSAADSVKATLLNSVTDTVSLENASDTQAFNAAGDSSGAQIWLLVGNSIDPSTVFAASAHDVMVLVRNTLDAHTEQVGELAWIQKKYTLQVGSSLITPIPGAVWLFGSALGGLLMRRRSRS